jgi:predicted NAD/FAD-binding protein
MPLETNPTTGDVAYSPTLAVYHADLVPSRRRSHHAWNQVLTSLTQAQVRKLADELEVLRRSMNLPLTLTEKRQ